MLPISITSTAASLTVLTHDQGLIFNDSPVFNHGIVTLDQIMNTALTALLCVTPAADCCTLAGSGDWFSPSGSVVTTSTSSNTYQVKSNLFVELRRISGGVEGIYRCDIRLSAGAARTSFYVGVYQAGRGAPAITGPLQFSLQTTPTADPPLFTLTCVSTGGPATTVTWTRDGNAATGDTSQTVTDMMTATYTNTLTVTGRLPGVYKCRIQNVRGVATEALTVAAPSAPGGVAVSEATGSSVRVTWTAAPPGNVELLGYQVSFERLPGRGCDSLHNDTKSVSSTTTDYTVTGLSGLSAYRISVVAANIFGLSMGVTSTIFHSLPTPPTGPPAGMNTTTTGISITVSWSPVPCLQRNSQIIGYIVRYSEVTSSRATSFHNFVAGGSSTSTTISGLQGSTHYSVEVAAVGAGELGVFSDPVTADATSSASTAPTASATSSNATPNTTVGAIVAIVGLVLILIAVVVLVPVIVWLVLKHRRAVMSLQKGSRIIPEPAEDKSCEYETIPLPRLPPARASSPTSSPQTSGPHTPALQDYRAVISGHARITAPSLSPPQELGGDEHLYEPTGAPTSTAMPTTATPTLSLGTK